MSFESRKLFAWAPLVFVLLYPVVCRYDFSRSTLWYFDFISMNPNVLWFSLLLTVLVVLAAWKNGDIPLPSLLAVMFLLSVMEVLTNYPASFAGDVYLQGAAVRGITEVGKIGSTLNQYPENSPGFFLMWSIITLVTGADIRATNLVLMLPVCAVLLMLLMFTLFRRLSVPLPGAATLLSILLLNYGDNEQMLLHFSTKLFSLILILGIVLVLTVMTVMKDRSSFFAFVTLILALVISHSVNGLVAVVFIAVYTLVTRERNRGALKLVALLCVVLFTLWYSSVAMSKLTNILQALLSSSNVHLTMEAAQRWVPTVTSSEPFFGVFLDTYYKALLGALVLSLAYCAIRFRKDRTVIILSSYFGAFVLVYGALLLIPNLNPIGPFGSVTRVILLSSISLAGGVVIALFSRQAGLQVRSRRTLIFVILVALLIFPHFIIVHRMPYALTGNFQSEENTALFLFDYKTTGQQIVSAGDHLQDYYEFYNPFFQGYTTLALGETYPVRSEANSLGGIAHFLTAQPGQGFTVLDSSDAAIWGLSGHARSYSESSTQWNNNVTASIDINPELNRVYSNGFQTLYSFDKT